MTTAAIITLGFILGVILVLFALNANINKDE